MERLDGLKPPRLALLAFGLGPADRLPVRRKHQPRAGTSDLDPVAARLIDIEEERLLDGVFVRTRLDKDAVLKENVGSTQDVFARVECVGHVVETALGAGVIARVSKVVGL